MVHRDRKFRAARRSFLAVPVFWVLFVARQVLSWRRATGERRAQLKWLMAGSAASVIGLAAGFLFQSGMLNTVYLAVGTFSLPVCITLAILKYRLYDIDRLISRTLSYTLVTGILVGVYAGLVLLSTEVFRFHSTVAVAASTLAVAALFSPLRRRVQHVIDRRFNRARYDTDQTIAAFAARLKEEVDLASIRDDLAGRYPEWVENTLRMIHTDGPTWAGATMEELTRIAAGGPRTALRMTALTRPGS